MMIFDAHFHIIDPRFPLVPNQGYLPPAFTFQDYLEKTKDLDIRGGAVVSGSFQETDQTYLIDALNQLGTGFVGVTQLRRADTSDAKILELHKAGIRAVRFNLKRGRGSEDVSYLDSFAKRIFELAGWHVELYVDSKGIGELIPILLRLPKVSIDHLGLSKEGFSHILKLAEAGVKIKATGFMRVDFTVKDALQKIHSVNPKALMFGTHLPGTRASRQFSLDDLQLIEECFDSTHEILWGNAVSFYGIG